MHRVTVLCSFRMNSYELFGGSHSITAKWSKASVLQFWLKLCYIYFKQQKAPHTDLGPWCERGVDGNNQRTLVLINEYRKTPPTDLPV